MPVRILSSEAVSRILELRKKPYRPPEILKLKADIEIKTNVIQERAETTGLIHPEDIKEVARMKLELDCLYGLWAEGKLG